MNVGSLFSGIGGFDLGLERAGMRTLWFCEQDAYCQRVLAKHWPSVPCYPDVRGLRASDLKPVDLLCGGFPCQNISIAGRGEGLAGASSGLWSEFARLISELRPSYVVVENVPVIRSRGLERVLADLAAFGYDAEWDCIPASAVGAPHQRDRFWLVAYPNSTGLERHRRSIESTREVSVAEGLLSPSRPWPDEPDFPRVVDGLHHWMERMKVTGNALVPQIAQWIGEQIMCYEEAM